MKKILLLVFLVLVIGGILYFLTSVKSNSTVWKYDKKIAVPLKVTSGKNNDATIGDLKTNGVYVVLPKGTFDTDTAIELKTPDKVPNYIKSEMTPLGSPIEISAGDKPIRLNEKIKITMAYDPVMVPKDIEVKKIRVLYYDGASWESLRPVSVDLEKSQVVFESYHFSVFGLNQVGDETKITENWIKSAAFDKTLRKGLNKKSDYITNQIIDMTLKKLGISDESTKGKILADILKDDGYADIVKAYASGDIVDGGQKVAALCGSKIVELVPKSILSKALNSVAGSSGDIAAAGKALGNIEAGQYKDAAKIIGEQIADKFLVVTAGKIAVQVVGAQIESWKNAEVEAAFQAYKNGANGAFWGYNVDKKDFDAVWIQMKGASRQLEIEAIVKENEIRKEAGMPTLTEKEEDSVRATVKESYRTQFATRIEKDAEIKKEEENLRTMVEAFQKADFFYGALAPAGLDKGLNYENTLDVLSHFMNKMMNDTNRFELSTKEGLIMDKAISVSDIVQGARIFFSLPDGKKKYGEYLKSRFGINLYPKLSDIAGTWENGSMTVTDVIFSDEFKKAIEEGAKGIEESIPGKTISESEGCDFSKIYEEVNKMKGKAMPISFSLFPSGETGGSMMFSSGGKDQKPLPFTYSGGVIQASMTESGATGVISMIISQDATGYSADGSMNISYKNDMIKIKASITASKGKSK